jgi:hypothetical protein
MPSLNFIVCLPTWQSKTFPVNKNIDYSNSSNRTVSKSTYQLVSYAKDLLKIMKAIHADSLVSRTAVGFVEPFHATVTLFKIIG